jgi:lysozyme
MEIEPSRGRYPRPRFYKVEKTMIISTAGVDLLTHFEGLRLEAYQDSVGVWTIGYGHTKGVTPSMKITESQANNLLKTELIEYQNYINSMVNISLDQCQFDALVCWVYNLGPTNLKNSTLLTLLNQGVKFQIPEQIRRWNRAGGKILKGLVRRREAEALMFAGRDWRSYKESEN